MIVDANLLLYAVDESSQQHETAREFLETCLNGDARVGLPWQSIGAFLRIATHPRIMDSPLRADEAVGYVDAWLAAPAAWQPRVGATTWSILRRLLLTYHVTANLIPDAQLAALAIEHGVPVASADSDFVRFSEVSWINPCAPN